MLENIREGLKGPWAIIIVALIVVSFVFTGVGSYLGSNVSDAVAVVNDEEIGQQQLEIAVSNERSRMESQFGEAVSTLFESDEYFNDFRQGILERIINEKLIAQKASELGLRVSDDQIKDAILQFPQFQVAGQFSNEVYQSSIRRAGYTPDQFAEFMRIQMVQEQLSQALLGSSISSKKLIENTLELQQQSRDAKYVEVPSEKYLDDVVVEDAEIQNFYEQNIDRYDTEERVKLSFVDLSVDNLMRDIEVEQTDIEAYYQENLAFYQTAEQREVAHILFESSEGDRSETAQNVLQQLESGADFAALALEFSDDAVSAEEGGSLGVIEQGDFDQAFSNAAFGLQNVGDVSAIVETEFGLHIIKLTALEPSVTTPLIDVREEIIENIKRDEATDELFALQAEMENVAFESIDSLDDVASLIDRPVLETGFFTRGNLPPSVNFPQVENVAFSEELIFQGVNSEVLSIDNDTVMVVRVAEHEPQRTLGLEEVQEDITQELKTNAAQQLALSWAQSVQEVLSSEADVVSMFEEKSLEWENFEALTRSSTDVPRNVISELFALSGADDNRSSVVSLFGGNVGLIVLEMVNQVETVSEDDINSFSPRLENQFAQRTFDNFVIALREDADITIVP